LRALYALAPHTTHLTEVIVLICASVVATLSRYVALRSWVFARSKRGRRTLLHLLSSPD
jgi:putative flippase GtrA